MPVLHVLYLALFNFNKLLILAIVVNLDIYIILMCILCKHVFHDLIPFLCYKL